MVGRYRAGESRGIDPWRKGGQGAERKEQGAEQGDPGAGAGGARNKRREVEVEEGGHYQWPGVGWNGKRVWIQVNVGIGWKSEL